MSYILFASSGGGITQPITLTADIDADDFSIQDLTELGAGSLGLTIGGAVSDIGFYGATPTGQPVLFSVTVDASPVAYDATDLDFQLSVLADGINEIITQLQNLGLAS